MVGLKGVSPAWPSILIGPPLDGIMFGWAFPTLDFNSFVIEAISLDDGITGSRSSCVWADIESVFA